RRPLLRQPREYDRHIDGTINIWPQVVAERGALGSVERTGGGEAAREVTAAKVLLPMELERRTAELGRPRHGHALAVKLKLGVAIAQVLSEQGVLDRRIGDVGGRRYPHLVERQALPGGEVEGQRGRDGAADALGIETQLLRVAEARVIEDGQRRRQLPV